MGNDGIAQAVNALTSHVDEKRVQRPTLSCNTIHGQPQSAGTNIRSPASPSSGKMGLPRSLEYMSPLVHNTEKNPFEQALSKNYQDEQIPSDLYRRRFHSADTDFRSALDYADPEQREKEREAVERIKRARRHESGLDRESWYPRHFKWLGSTEGTPVGTNEQTPNTEIEQTRSVSPPPAPRFLALTRSSTQPTSSPRAPGHGWTKIRSIFVNSTQTVQQNAPSSVAGTSVNITDELITGGLSALMLRMWFERDEHGSRRIPALLHRLRIRVSDSLHPLHSSKAVFRIEVWSYVPSSTEQSFLTF